MRSDNDLMALVKDGDKEAYNELVKKYRVSAISFAYSFLSDLCDAEDVVQDVFVNIYIRRASYRPTHEFKTYLYQSIRNKSIDYLRKSKIRTTVDINSINELAKGCSAEQSFFQIENDKLLFDLLNSLRDDYKTALYLFAVEGESYIEIARIMKKTLPQVKTLIYRARKSLKLKLQTQN